MFPPPHTYFYVNLFLNVVILLTIVPTEEGLE